MWFANVWDELDFWMMSTIIVLPAVFALGLIFFPSRRTEPMRWWTLIGTLATFVGICMLFVDFLRLTDQQITNPDRSAQLLSSRAELQLANLERHEPMSSLDLVARKAWIGRFHIDFYVGVDGVTMAMLLLTGSLFVLAAIASWTITHSLRGYCFLFLLVESGLLGLFLSLDFFLFYVFLEVTLIPFYLLITYWGANQDKTQLAERTQDTDHTAHQSAALPFILTSILGSVLILVAMLALYFVDLRPQFGELQEKARAAREAGGDRFSLEVIRLDAFRGLAGDRLDRDAFSVPVNTFDLLMLAQAGQYSAKLETRIRELEQALQNRSEDQTLRGQLEQAELEKIHWQTMSPPFQLFCFLLLFIGFALKLPIVPLHSWLPAVLQQAPTPVAMILCGIVLKMGVYGLFRIAFPICPQAAHQLAWVVGLVGVVGIVYGALVALAQEDFRRQLAYVSISVMGFVLLGISAWTTPDLAQYWAWGVKGAVFQCLSHGYLIAGLLFAAGLIRERTGTVQLQQLGGIGTATPIMASLTMILMLASAGLPLLSGFIGEFCTLLGSWNFRPLNWPAAGQVFSMVAAGSIVLITGCMLWTIQRVFLHPHTWPTPLDDLDGREGFILGSLVVLTVLLGLWPMLVFDWVEPTITGWVQTLAGVMGG